MDHNRLFIGLILLSAVTAVDILDIQLSKREKECYGTNMGFSFTGTREYHYEALRRRYSGCTHVQGNLEVTNLSDNWNVTHDLSFLSTIKVVTGYVLLGLLNVETVPLTSLRLIRGDRMLQLSGKKYALFVALTSEGTPTADNPTPGLKEIQMPSLREISRGKVKFTQNPLLCYIDTIDWSAITKDEVILEENADPSQCEECPLNCKGKDDASHCWGKGPNMCQRVDHVECDPICPGKCFKEGIIGCCHPQCAVGCRNGLDTECEMCKYFRHGLKCVQQCPEGTYSIAQECIDF
ncbi:epidermal growth factor receptor-like [Mercenaria mercenaria]|uniref:epidermal growth factor receptor-like n=1 Tax=Mercenaria mercenaria TaxID=6596 RepID=UPI001E1D94ED|nr:epidermal growth factor receptor-like [Mercenaria mercenaria]